MCSTHFGQLLDYLHVMTDSAQKPFWYVLHRMSEHFWQAMHDISVLHSLECAYSLAFLLDVIHSHSVVYRGRNTWDLSVIDRTGLKSHADMWRRAKIAWTKTLHAHNTCMVILSILNSDSQAALDCVGRSVRLIHSAICTHSCPASILSTFR